MNISREEYESSLLHAFRQGVNIGYGIDHTQIDKEERQASKKFIRERNFKYSYDKLMGIENKVK